MEKLKGHIVGGHVYVVVADGVHKMAARLEGGKLTLTALGAELMLAAEVKALEVASRKRKPAAGVNEVLGVSDEVKVELTRG